MSGDCDFRNILETLKPAVTLASIYGELQCWVANGDWRLLLQAS